MLELGIKAPDFELPDQNGEVHKLSDYAGKKVILYFYPAFYSPCMIRTDKRGSRNIQCCYNHQF